MHDHRDLNRVLITTALAALLTGCLSDADTPDSSGVKCGSPAPLLGEYDPATPGFVFVFRGGVDGPDETERLAVRYDFTPTGVHESALSGFAADPEVDVVQPAWSKDSSRP